MRDILKFAADALMLVRDAYARACTEGRPYYVTYLPGTDDLRLLRGDEAADADPAAISVFMINPGEGGPPDFHLQYDDTVSHIRRAYERALDRMAPAGGEPA